MVNIVSITALELSSKIFYLPYILSQTREKKSFRSVASYCTQKVRYIRVFIEIGCLLVRRPEIFK